MFEVAFNLFGFPITTYGICLALAFLFAIFLLPKELQRRGYNPNAADLVILAAMIGGIAGAKIFHILEYRAEIFEAGVWWNLTNWSAENPANLIKAKFWPKLFSRPGLTFYGGLLVATAAVIWAYRYSKIPFLQGTDATMPGLAMGYFWGRLGCFASGDGCYGVAATDSWLFPPFVWQYPEGVSQPTSGVVYNTPVMEAFLSLCIFFLLMRLRHVGFRVGFLSALFMILHGLGRFSVEFIRHNQAETSFVGLFGIEQYEWSNPALPEGAAPETVVKLTSDAVSNFQQLEAYNWQGITMAQWISIVLISWGVAWVVRKKLWIKDGPKGSEGGEAVAKAEAATSG